MDKIALLKDLEKVYRMMDDDIEEAKELLGEIIDEVSLSNN